MFEPPQSKEKSGGAGLYIVIAIVIVVVVGGAWAYMNSKDSAKAPDAAAATSTAATQANADPTHDLRVVSSKMEKDLAGTTAVWTLELKNQSSTFTYSNIGYETTYAGRDSTVLAQNQGTIPSLTLGPGESQEADFRDTQYPTGTVLFRVRITGATASK